MDFVSLVPILGDEHVLLCCDAEVLAAEWNEDGVLDRLEE